MPTPFYSAQLYNPIMEICRSYSCLQCVCLWGDPINSNSPGVDNDLWDGYAQRSVMIPISASMYYV